MEETDESENKIVFPSPGFELQIPGHDDENDEEDDYFLDAELNVASHNPVSNKERPSDTGEDVRKFSTHGSVMRKTSSARKIKLAYEPTYRMEPKPDGFFIWFKVRDMIDKLLVNILNDFSYEEKSAALTAKLICNRILVQAKKKFDWPRYRYVCHVTLAQLKNQGIIIADRCLWMSAFDNYAPYVYRTKSFVLVITFFALFQE